MINFILNGKEVSYDGNPGLRLLEVIRNTFNYTGVKEGCGEGECGACAVIIDGLLVDTCLIAVGSIEGKEIMTIEGYKDMKSERFTIISDAYSKCGAVQCGMCTPGMVMATESLLVRNPYPSEREIRTAISSNLCRCTGYNMIVEAVRMAAKEGEGLW